MECLLRLLRNAPVDQRMLVDDYDAMIALADEERILTRVAALLRVRGDVLTPALANRLGQIERDAAIAAFYWSSQLKELLRALHQSQIATVPLKGPLLAERLYGNAALRTNRDLDLLVSKADYARAEAVLDDLGFAPGEMDDYHRPWHRQLAVVELHYDVENPLAFDFGVESAMSAAHPAEFQGVPCLQFSAQDELAYLCLHAVRHRYERLSLIVDLQLAFEKLVGSASRCVPRPQAMAMISLVILGQAMAHHLQGRGLRASTSSDREEERLLQLSDVLWDRLLMRSSVPLDWSDLHAFYLEIERPGWARLRRLVSHLQILTTRLISPDYRFAAKFGMYRKWQVHMLRPLRLLSRCHGVGSIGSGY